MSTLAIQGKRETFCKAPALQGQGQGGGVHSECWPPVGRQCAPPRGPSDRWDTQVGTSLSLCRALGG